MRHDGLREGASPDDLLLVGERELREPTALAPGAQQGADLARGGARVLAGGTWTLTVGTWTRTGGSRVLTAGRGGGRHRLTVRPEASRPP